MENNTTKEEEKEEEIQYLRNVIGVPKLKRKLSFFIRSYQKTGILPHILLNSPKGNGKSMVANALGDELDKLFITVNVGSCRVFADFWDNIVIRHLANGQKATVFLDEIGEMTPKFAVALLTILNPNSDNITQFTFNGQTVTFDFRNVSFVGATTCKNKMLPALVDRFEVCEIPPYSVQDLGEIIVNSLNKISKYEKNIDRNILPMVASVVRQNPRSGIKLSNYIYQYLSNKEEDWLTLSGFNELKKQLNILDLGLSEIELKIMKILENGPKTLTHIAAKLGASKAAVQEYEYMLLNYNLLQITVEGRKLTQNGHKYLKDQQNLEG
jgi:Holliday junction resolvasome RuvABC ATP-dependent DNA helicase subunit